MNKDSGEPDNENKTQPKWSVIESIDTNGAWLRAHVPLDDQENVWLIGGQPEQGAIKIGNAEDGFEILRAPEGIPLLKLGRWNQYQHVGRRVKRQYAALEWIGMVRLQSDCGGGHLRDWWLQTMEKPWWQLVVHLVGVVKEAIAYRRQNDAWTPSFFQKN